MSKKTCPVSLGICRDPKCGKPVLTGQSFDMWVERWWSAQNGYRADIIKRHRECNPWSNHSKDGEVLIK